jgi:hypothetical protein
MDSSGSNPGEFPPHDNEIMRLLTAHQGMLYA